MTVILKYICSFLLFIQLAHCNEERLLQNLFRSYNPEQKPEGKVTVPFGVALVQVQDVTYHSKTADVTMMTWRRQLWKDSRLTWEPADNSGITVVRTPAKNVWKPDITLFNSMTADSEIDTLSQVWVYNTGEVLYIPRVVERITCPLTEDRKPVCYLKYGSWVYDGYNLDLDFYEGVESLDVYDYIPGEYNLEDIAAAYVEKFYPCCLEPYPVITFNVTITPRT